jgi:hypothetical protein
MVLSCFWRRHRRLLGWSVFLLAMVGIGTAVYVMLPPEPRWMFADGPSSVFYAGDGNLRHLPDPGRLGPWPSAALGCGHRP